MVRDTRSLSSLKGLKIKDICKKFDRISWQPSLPHSLLTNTKPCGHFEFQTQLFNGLLCLKGCRIAKLRLIWKTIPSVTQVLNRYLSDSLDNNELNTQSIIQLFFNKITPEFIHNNTLKSA